MIDPLILFGQGCCSECGQNLYVMDIESTLMLLDNDGSPVDETTIVRCVGHCPRCNKDYPMLRYGLKYVFDNEYNVAKLRYEHVCFQHRVKKEMDESKAPEDNPFMINRD